MLDYRQIDFHPDAKDPAALSQRLRAYDQDELHRRLDSLGDWDDVPVGRPRTELDPQLARTILTALESGQSKSSVARRYGRIGRFSRPWLVSAFKDGRLHQMAAG